MGDLQDAALLLALLLSASFAGLLVRPMLSERHRSAETVQLIQLVVTMLVTFAALVLGLLTTSVKASFDTIGNDVRGFAADIIQLDQLLTEYGSATDAIRQDLRSYTAAAIATTWVKEPGPPGDYYPRVLPKTSTDAFLESSALGARLADIGMQIRSLEPTDMIHQKLATEALGQFTRLIERRWKLIEEAHSSISVPFYIVLVFWLMIVFASFGLSAPRNALAAMTILMGALSIASATFVILELDSPFRGWFTAPSQPMRDALAHLSR